MNKPNTSIEGKNVKVGDLLVNRLLPTNSIRGVGPFLLLDHGYPVTYKNDSAISSSLNEHPHRGLVAFTYIIKGEVEHFDSLGNHELIGEGGAHWLSSGSGVIHAERVSARLVESSGTFHAIQFWINIPAAHKNDPPAYKPLNAKDFPLAELPDHSGTIRALLGKCGSIESPVESLSREFLYRVRLNPKSEFKLTVSKELSRAVFAPDDPVYVNRDFIAKSELLIPEEGNEEIVLRNPGISPVDVFILGGPEPAEPIVVQGPFVMNTQQEIADAYRDFFAGLYGTISKPEPV